MRKISLTLILLIFVSIIYAQKLKIDDGTITIDKKPIAKLEGNSGVFKGIDLTYKSLAGDVLFNITLGQSHYFIPTWSETYWYEIVFANPSVRVRYSADAGLNYSEKKISELFLVKVQPSLLNNDAIDESALKEFVAKNDASEKIMKDSIVYMEYETALIQKLTETKIERDLTEPVILKQTNVEAFGNRKTYSYDIEQDKIVIGSIEKFDEQSTVGRTVNYKIFKKFTSPLKIEDKTLNNGLALYCEMSAFPRIYTIQDKSITELKTAIEADSEQFLAEFLIKRGLL